MDTKQFLSEFGHIAKAPGGVQKLREMIYQFAITGGLSSTGLYEKTGHALLDAITLEKKRRIKEKKFKRSPKLEKISGNSVFELVIPKHWAWTDLVSIGEINPKNAVSDEQNASFVPMRAISQMHGVAITPETRKWGKIKKGYTQFADGDVVVAKITPCFENRKSAVISELTNGVGAGTTELHVVRPLPGIIPGYIYVFLRSPYFMVKGEQNMTGTAGQKRLPSEYFASRPMPLPSTEEQASIVAKVDELMVLCDQLEEYQLQKRTIQNQLRKATLQAVASASSPFELKQHWQRLESNLQHLCTEPEDVTELRQLILDLAFQGLISEKKKNDSKVIALVDALIASKKRMIERGEIKRKKSASTDILEDEFTIPTHWERLELEEVFRFIDYRGKTPPKVSSGITLVTAKNVKPGSIEKEPAEFITKESYENWMTRGFPKQGDLLITTEAPLGNVARIDDVPDFALAQRVIDLQPYCELNSVCIMYFMMSPIFQQQLEINATGMTAKGIKASKLKQIKLPIPPVEEAERIVKRVSQLMAICDTLEKRLKSANSVAEKLAIATVASLTGIQSPEEDEPLKTPQTELVSLIKLGRIKPDNKANAPLTVLVSRANGEIRAKDLWQRFGGEIDAFYAQLKTEVVHGWLAEPQEAVMLEKDSDK